MSSAGCYIISINKLLIIMEFVKLYGNCFLKLPEVKVANRTALKVGKYLLETQILYALSYSE